jgi:signal transduction histidine kinase
LKITVSDQGPGISKDYLGRITEPFFTTKKSAGHSGFGLSNAKKIILALAGQLEVSSTKGAGTQATMYLPISYE